MANNKNPDISPELAKRIRLFRRDMGGLLFHFTRKPEKELLENDLTGWAKMVTGPNAFNVLEKILEEGKLKGTGTWTNGEACVCFTEAPIHEFNTIFSLVELAASEKERPRYEPYGIAIDKTWLFEQGGRPVIYDHPDSLKSYPKALQYRLVPYNPKEGIDFTWEREWRIKTKELILDPLKTLVVVPTADEAFEIVYGYSKLEPEWDVEGGSGEGHISGAYHEPKWLAVSLDLFTAV
jgi:hypothetical protein